MLHAWLKLLAMLDAAPIIDWDAAPIIDWD